VLLPGDPGRALRLAQALLNEPKMFNHHRGLWGYTGPAQDGEPLTIQSTGMGGPSAAIVVSELVTLGARRLLRLGTCGALDDSLELGDLLIATEAIPADGTSRALGADERVPASSDMVESLTRVGAGRPATVVSSDLFYDDRVGLETAWLTAGASAVEMEAATLFALAAKHGLPAGALLIVSDRIAGEERTRIEADALHQAEYRAGELAVRALG
jgi:DeoD family purine-nucleoside phosphorylase